MKKSTKPAKSNDQEKLKTLEAKMKAFMKDTGERPTDDEVRELCRLRGMRNRGELK